MQVELVFHDSKEPGLQFHANEHSLEFTMVVVDAWDERLDAMG
jgi:hypothetical protein